LPQAYEIFTHIVYLLCYIALRASPASPQPPRPKANHISQAHVAKKTL